MKRREVADMFGQGINRYEARKATFWQRLGFGHCNAPVLEDERFADPRWAPGYMSTHAYVVLDWRDRLRVLISGRIKTATSIKTDAQVIQTHSECAFSVLPPGAPMPWNPDQGRRERDENLSKP